MRFLHGLSQGPLEPVIGDGFLAAAIEYPAGAKPQRPMIIIQAQLAGLSLALQLAMDRLD
jgi:hypothetical protein